MPTVLEVVGPKAGGAPLAYTLTEQGTVDLQAVYAVFNGAGAAVAFRPTVTIRAQNGTLLWRGFPSETVAVGDTAEVSYAPFLGGAGGAAGEGLAFDTDNQGGYLSVTTNALEPGTGSYGLVLRDTTDGLFLVTEGDDSALELEAGGGSSTGGNVTIIANGTGASGGVNLEAEDLVTILAGNDMNVNVGRDVGFYLDGAGRSFTVHDSGGNPIFRVDEDGSLHGLTGQALTFDL